jgi:long-chain acyl-CoA synthetase
MRWWQDRSALRRYVIDLVAGEFAVLRPGLPLPAANSWADDLVLDGDGLGADSLELLSLASALNETLHLHRAGAEDYLLVRRTLGGWLDVVTWCLERFDAEIGFRTSGTSGTPKLCVHAVDRLNEETDFLASLIGPRRRVVRVVPSHHIYGFLFTVMLPGKLGAEVVDTRHKLRLSPQPGDLIVGYPEFWAMQLRHRQPWPDDVIGVVSTGPCPPEVAAGLRASGLARFIEVYGSSETGGIGWRDGGNPDYQLFPHFDCLDGTILHRKSGIPAALQDRLAWHGPRHFSVEGRLDGVIQVGGVNVSPSHVQAVLESHPDVSKAVIRPMPVGDGLRLKAFIVPAETGKSESELRQAIETWIADRLSAPERPRNLTFGASLPVGAYGKAADWQVADAGAGRP